MAMMLGALYQALVDAHASEESARRAAEEVAAYDTRLNTIDTKLAVLQALVGVDIALTIGVLWLVFSILSRLKP
jgi:hypothetical protein